MAIIKQENEITNYAENCWIPVKTFAQQVKWPTESALRSYIFKADELGLQEAFLRVKRRVLVNPKRFFDLIQKINFSNWSDNEYKN